MIALRLLLAVLLALGVSSAGAIETHQRVVLDDGLNVTPPNAPLGTTGNPLYTTASLGAFAPNGNYATLAVTTTSARVALPSGATVVVYNNGAIAASVLLGGSGVTALTTNDQVGPGQWLAFSVGANTYIAAITATGAANLVISGGAGLPAGAGNAGATVAAQGSTTSGQTGTLGLGAVTSSAPAYTNGQSSPLSLAPDGTLRVSANNVVAALTDNHIIGGTYVAPATPAAVSIKGAVAGRIYAVEIANTTASPAWVKIFSASPTLGTTAAVRNFGCPAGQTRMITFADMGDYLAGSWFAVTGGAPLTDNTSNAAPTTSASVTVNYWYY